MTVRYYSSVAAETTLVGSITNASTSIQLASTVGLPALTPFTMALDYETASEELVEVTAVAGPTLTVTRAIDGTSATSHNSGARCRHVSSARDFADSRSHENASTNVHGIGASAAVVGTSTTQTLSNKTLNAATGTLDRIDITSSGTPWTTSVSGVTANVVDLFRWKQDTSATHEVSSVTNSGGFKARNASPAADAVNNTYRFRATKDDGSTDIFFVLSGGHVKTFPATGESGITIQPSDSSASVRAIALRDPADSLDRFVVWRDGHVDINGSNAAFSTFDVTAPAAPVADMMRVMDNGGTSQFAVQSTGRTLANRGATVAQPSILSGTVLQVGGSNVGYTGNLQTWVSPSNTVVASIDEAGHLTSATSSVTGTSVVTVATGWSLGVATAIIRAGIATVNLFITRTGADIPASSAGNITDTAFGTIAAGVRPNSAFGAEEMTFILSDGFGDGAARMTPTTGAIEIVSWSANGAIVAGRNYRMTMTYSL